MSVPQIPLDTDTPGTKVPSDETLSLYEYRVVTHTDESARPDAARHPLRSGTDESAGPGAGGRHLSAPIARTWMKALLLAAVVAYLLAVASLGKADQGGKGLQIMMVIITSVMLLGVVLLRRRAFTAGQAAAGAPGRIGQYATWLGFVRVALLAGALLSAFAIGKATEEQRAFPAIMLVLNLWLLSIVIRLHRAAQKVSLSGSAQ